MILCLEWILQANRALLWEAENRLHASRPRPEPPLPRSPCRTERATGGFYLGLLAVVRQPDVTRQKRGAFPVWQCVGRGLVPKGPSEVLVDSMLLPIEVG